MRGRGLKPACLITIVRKHQVAPHAGAWIETFYRRGIKALFGVAPHAGAWIETSITP